MSLEISLKTYEVIFTTALYLIKIYYSIIFKHLLKATKHDYMYVHVFLSKVLNLYLFVINKVSRNVIMYLSV